MFWLKTLSFGPGHRTRTDVILLIMEKILVGSFILACVGVTIEVLLTAATNFYKKRDTRLKGYSYVWMLPIYGLAYPLFVWLWPMISGWNIVARGILYLVLLFAVEYLSGWLLRKLIGKCPWEEQYKGKKWSINNLVRLDYAPGWFVVALLFERLYLFIDKIK